MPPGAQAGFTAGLVLATLALLTWAARSWRRERDPVPTLVLAGALVCGIFEPIVDILGLCWYPRHGQWKLFETFGRPIPVAVPFGYTAAFGGLTIAFLEVIRRRGVDALPLAWLISIAATTPFEIIAVQTKFYVYYGHQPLEGWGYPAWWAPVNLAVPVCAAVTITYVRSHLRGWRMLAVPAVITLVDGGINGATAWPSWTVLNTPNLSSFVVHLGGLSTWALAALLVWLVTRLPAAERANR